jgi:hypothetical protein
MSSTFGKPLDILFCGRIIGQYFEYLTDLYRIDPFTCLEQGLRAI